MRPHGLCGMPGAFNGERASSENIHHMLQGPSPLQQLVHCGGLHPKEGGPRGAKTRVERCPLQQGSPTPGAADPHPPVAC